jgi:hypothetical protein
MEHSSYAADRSEWLLAFYKYRLDRSRFGTAATVNAQRLAVNRPISGAPQRCSMQRARALHAWRPALRCAALRSVALRCVA